MGSGHSRLLFGVWRLNCSLSQRKIRKEGRLIVEVL